MSILSTPHCGDRPQDGILPVSEAPRNEGKRGVGISMSPVSYRASGEKQEATRACVASSQAVGPRIKITALVENISDCDLTSVHGLSLYIQTARHRLLFDLGPDTTLFENAKRRSIDLTGVDTVIVSHGHYDHGGALRQFLEINKKAKIYVQRTAFDKHFSKSQASGSGESIGLDDTLMENGQLVLLYGDHRIDDELQLFTVPVGEKCRSEANDCLYNEHGRDDFFHEQNLIIRSGGDVLITGCGHRGIVNILERALEFDVKTCVGGFHLYNPDTKRSVGEKTLSAVASELEQYGIDYYTCHCTGIEAYAYLRGRLPVKYLSCGMEIEV